MSLDKLIDYSIFASETSLNTTNELHLRRETRKIGPYSITFIIDDLNNNIEVECIQIDKNFVGLKEFINNIPYIDTSNVYNE